MTDLTLAIIKPDSYEKSLEQIILARILSFGFKPIAVKYKMLTTKEAKEFYNVHSDKEFFEDLIDFMTSGPIVVYVFQKENAVKELRKIIGVSDPNEAEPGTIRSIYGEGLPRNAIHGSDSNKNAEKEILFFFPELLLKFAI